MKKVKINFYWLFFINQKHSRMSITGTSTLHRHKNKNTQSNIAYVSKRITQIKFENFEGYVTNMLTWEKHQSNYL